jgi:hypothetical protein
MMILTTVAAASRKPTASENKEIRRVVLQTCRHGNPSCVYRGARVSSRDRRFAYSSAEGRSFSPQGILKRRKKPRKRWRWVIQQSGGPDSCSTYRKIVPVRVLREFKIYGLQGSNTVRC